MKKILDTDPRTRITIDEIREHSWYKQVVAHEKEGIIIGVSPIPINLKILEHLTSFGFNVDYTKKCLEQNKHNHFTTSYYLILKKFVENNGHLELEIDEEQIEKVGNKTAYAGGFKAAIRGTSEQPKIAVKNKIDPFSHLTPVARRFIENSELVTTKVYSSNTNRRMNSTGVGQKRSKNSAESPGQNIDGSNASYSPRRADLKPSNPNTKFTTTVMGPFRGKGGYSAPEK